MKNWEIDKHFQDEKEEHIEETRSDTVRHKGPSRKTFILGLIIAAILLLGMFGYAVSQPIILTKLFPAYFTIQEKAAEEMTRNQAEIMDTCLIPINKSQTYNGYTITLQSGICDNRRVIFIFEVAAPAGITLDSNTCILDCDIEVEKPHPNTGNYSAVVKSGFQIPDEDPFDNRFCVAKEVTVQPPESLHYSLADGAIGVIKINSLLDSSDSKKAPEVIAEGPWKFTCEFSDELVATQEVEMLQKPVRAGALRSLKTDRYESTVTVTSFQLSSLSATCVYKVPFTGRWEGIMLKPIYIVMKDGSKIPAHFIMSLNRGRTEECTYHFDSPVSVADVDHVEFTN